MAKQRAFYMVLTTNEDLAKELWAVIDRYRTTRWWKRVTKYYKGDDPEPYYETSESSAPVQK